MKYLFILFLFIAGCSWFEANMDQHTRVCVMTCAVLNDAQCWNKAEVSQIMGASMSMGSCVSKCRANDALISNIDLDCIVSSNKCDLSKCIDVEY